MRETVYIVTTDNLPVQDWLLDRMGGWDVKPYRDGIAIHGLRKVAYEDWLNCWMQGDDVFYNYEAAKVYSDGYSEHILTLHLEDVEEAIRRLVGIEEA